MNNITIQKETPSNTVFNTSEDEINLIELFQMIWNKKIQLLIFMFFCLILTTVITKFSPKQYKSYTTFHIHSEMTTNSSLNKYAGLLGIQGSSSDLNNIVQSLLESYSLKSNVANHVKPYFKNAIESAIKEKRLINSEDHITSFLIGNLKLNKNFIHTMSKNGQQKITFFSTDTNLSKEVLSEYLHQLEFFNKELELSAQKKFITIIDPPKIALSPFKPNLKLNLLLVSITSLFLGCSAILIKTYFHKK